MEDCISMTEIFFFEFFVVFFFDEILAHDFQKSHAI